MQSSIGWIDFSSLDRDRVKSVLNLLIDPGMVDELGIGSIRDSFSDSLFPGISTIQTHAKYFITVPRIIRDFEAMTDAKQRRAVGLANYLATQEDNCARLFAKSQADLPEEKRSGSGIIGITALDKGVIRKPSEIYWGGLRRFGLVKTRLSRSEFCRSIGQSSSSLRATMNVSETEGGDDRDASDTSNSVCTPEYPSAWQENLSIDLNKEEAEFLVHQMDRPQLLNSLLSELLRNEKLRNLVLQDEIKFHDLPDLLKGKINSHTFQIVQQAVDFWVLMKGAHIRYNCLLHSQFGTPESLDKFESEWQEWCQEIAAFPWDLWSLDGLWELADTTGHRVRKFTREFVKTWSNESRLGAGRKGASKRFDAIVIRQEQLNKRGKARLPQESMSVRDRIGISVLSYRFPQVKRILDDIQQGLSR